MGTGRARPLLAAALLAALGGCATGEPRPILSAAELDAMIKVEVERIEPRDSYASVVAGRQP